MIKFFDITSINNRFETEFQQGFKTFVKSGQYILGNQVQVFEANFAKYCGTQYCIGTGNGLDALMLIFKAYIELGKLQKGDEVIVPANTYMASILSIVNADLTPVLVEPDAITFNISPSEIEKAITNKTKAILVVHLYGQLADVNAIIDLAQAHNLLIIEDAAQAHGAVNNNSIKAGNLCDAAAFSFYPTKNLGALGDGGGVTTNDRMLAESIRKLSNYGQNSKNIHEYKGYNSRLDEIQAMILNIKLKVLDDDNAERISIANRYLGEIRSDKIQLPSFLGGNDHVFHQFVIRTDDRDSLQHYLKNNGIETLIHYPIPPHQQKALKTYRKLKFPITENIHKTVLSLPIYPTLSMENIETIIHHLNTY